MYFLLAPHATLREVEAAAKAGRDLPLNPRKVLRVSANGKKRTSFDPVVCSKLADAKALTTLGIALDKQGTLFLLVWATWGAGGGQVERSGQYIVSITERGQPGAQVEVDSEEILVHQFEVFGSGEFLLRGRRTGTVEKRVAILSASGGALRDVRSWSGHPREILDEPSEPGGLLFDYLVRGGDGRIYFAEQEARQEGVVVVYAFEPSGDSSEVLRLRPMPRDRQFSGLGSAGGRLAAMYLEGASLADSSREQETRWWIAVYDNVVEGELQSVYGPASTQPVCYQHSGSEDRFTFLIDGDRLVTMAP